MSRCFSFTPFGRFAERYLGVTNYHALHGELAGRRSVSGKSKENGNFEKFRTVDAVLDKFVNICTTFGEVGMCGGFIAFFLYDMDDLEFSERPKNKNIEPNQTLETDEVKATP